MTPIDDAEVIVVGAGPAGSTTAALLAELGHDVLLLDRAEWPREKPCAEYFSPGVDDVLVRIGAYKAVIGQRHARLQGMRIETGGSSFCLNYPDAAGAVRSALAIDRPTFDCVLLDHARARGARFSESTLVTDCVIEHGRVAGVRCRVSDGERELRARFVIAADGLRSAVTRSVGLALISR